MTRCDGTAITVNTPTLITGTAIATGYLAWTSATNIITVTIPATAYTYIGSIDIMYTGTLYTDSSYKNFLRLEIQPPVALLSDPATPNHDISTCEEAIYPLKWGGPSSNIMQLNHAIMDEYGNHILCGQSNLTPFSSNTATSN